jgi:hypothetical protein
VGIVVERGVGGGEGFLDEGIALRDAECGVPEYAIEVVEETNSS